MPSYNDYIIALDEQGKPYIAHGLLSNLRSRFLKNRSGSTGKSQQRSPRPNHKYIMRIDDNGRRRYFYTREQIQAYYKSKKDKEAASNNSNQNESSLQDTAKKAVSSAKGQLESLAEEAKKAATETKAETTSNTKPTPLASKPSTGIAEYARRKAAESTTPKTTSKSAEADEDDDDDSSTKKSTKSKKAESSDNSSGSSSGRSSSGSSRGSSQQSAPASQMPSEMIQQALKARGSVSTTPNDSSNDTEDTIAKAAKKLAGADKYEAYKKAVEDYKINPTKENADKRDKLRQEWLSTQHGKFVSSMSSELKNKKNATEQKKAINSLPLGAESRKNIIPVAFSLNNSRR